MVVSACACACACPCQCPCMHSTQERSLGCRGFLRQVDRDGSRRLSMRGQHSAQPRRACVLWCEHSASTPPMNSLPMKTYGTCRCHAGQERCVVSDASELARPACDTHCGLARESSQIVLDDGALLHLVNLRSSMHYVPASECIAGTQACTTSRYWCLGHAEASRKTALWGDLPNGCQQQPWEPQPAALQRLRGSTCRSSCPWKGHQSAGSVQLSV